MREINVHRHTVIVTQAQYGKLDLRSYSQQLSTSKVRGSKENEGLKDLYFAFTHFGPGFTPPACLFHFF